MTDFRRTGASFALDVRFARSHSQVPQRMIAPPSTAHAACNTSSAKAKEDEPNGDGAIAIGLRRKRDCGRIGNPVLESERKTYAGNKRVRNIAAMRTLKTVLEAMRVTALVRCRIIYHAAPRMFTSARVSFTSSLSIFDSSVVCWLSVGASISARVNVYHLLQHRPAQAHHLRRPPLRPVFHAHPS